MTVLEKIERLRKERGWSVNNLALEAMLTQSTVNNLYSRNAEPKISTLRAICAAFGITLSEFFADCDNENNTDDVSNEIKRRILCLNDEQKSALLTLLRAMD